MNSTRLMLSFVVSSLLLSNAASLAQTKTTTKAVVKSSATKGAPSKKDIARAWYEELIVKENLSKVDDLVADDCVMEFGPSFVSKATNSNKVVGKENIRKHLKNIADNFNYKGELLDVIGEGDKVVLYRIVEEADKAGHKVFVPWVSIIEVKDNKIKKITHVHDTLHEQNGFKKTK